MYIVIAYDIVDDRKRNKTAKELLNYGRRVQKSVFECLLEEKELLEVKEKLSRIIDYTEDTVRFYFLCNRCVSAIEILGKGKVSEEEDLIII